MQLEILGTQHLHKRLNNVSDIIQNKFWVDVEKDLFKNLEDKTRRHWTGSPSKLERNIYAKQIDGGVEGGVKDDGMMVTWRGGRINYGMFLEYGTRPHIIRPKKKKSLRWSGKGGDIFAGEVNHPGTKATYFLRDSANKTFKNLNKIFKQNMKDI